MPDRRAVLAGGGAWTLLAAARAPQAVYDAVVAKPGSVAPAGARYASLAEALKALRVAGRPARVWLGQGTWREKLTLTTPDVWITGEHRHRTVLSFDAAAGLPDPEGKPWGTSGSATLTVLAPGFHAERMTIANGFDPREGRRLSGEGSLGQQAVALMLSGDSDRAVLRDVDVLGYQDTLFLDAGRAVFENCLVAGTVDFVFGGGAALLRHCEIRSRVRPGDPTSGGFVAAPSTRREQALGLVFDRCRLTRERGVGDGAVYLGRPWRPTRSFAGQRYGDPEAVGMAAFLGCRMDAHIAAAGWTAMNYNGADGQRHALQPEEVRFAEWMSSGPGAAGARRGEQLTRAQAKPLLAFFDRQR